MIAGIFRLNDHAKPENYSDPTITLLARQLSFGSRTHTLLAPRPSTSPLNTNPIPWSELYPFVMTAMKHEKILNHVYSKHDPSQPYPQSHAASYPRSSKCVWFGRGVLGGV
jgi:hypothetical protein